ncbi:Metal chaperone, involved in Zn homeostasis [Olavius sp. associated proteobacterium Delta 1]|nr:Metal chaperone, involved in Zn homeostasis [Olavius sp. associated proteobacterium Delta 1]
MSALPGNQPEYKADLLLLAGFLGAGKTTLLKRILSWEADLSETVVLVNEFGDIGIDGALLKYSGSDVIELTSGCICCTLSADLHQSLKRIWNRFKPRRIIIESSGVADPQSIAPVLTEPGIRPYMDHKKTVTVLDADYWEAREAFGPLFYNQLEMADLILLNKIDLAKQEKIPRFLKEIHEIIPGSQVIPTIHCGIDPESLWLAATPKTLQLMPIRFFHPISSNRNTDLSDPHHSDREHDNIAVDARHYVTFSFQEPNIVDETRFKKFISNLPWEVFRIKGPIRFADHAVMLNFVGGKSEWTPWEGESQTQLAFIGWNINPEEILKKAASCIK